jgi:putative ABC transport system ATP-binding protein
VSALVLRHVSRTRGGGARAVRALADVSLAVEPRDVVLLEGPSGSGKTTLLVVAAVLLSADAGDVVLAGRSLAGLGQAARGAWRARHVGFVFQRANLLEGLDVRGNVLLAAALAGVPRRDAEAETNRLLEGLGVARLARRRADQLSGGEEHRVALARALVHRPAVVFADEPTGSLDTESGLAVAEALASLAREADVAVVIATHDARLRPFATRRITMIDGRIVEDA